MAGDNYQVRVVGEGKEVFAKALSLCIGDHRSAVAYATTEKFGLVLFWSKPESRREGWEVKDLPYEMEGETLFNFAWGWLQKADFPEEPDHDGSNGKGFEISTGDFWGHVGDFWESICFIKPDWQMYGK